MAILIRVAQMLVVCVVFAPAFAFAQGIPVPTAADSSYEDHNQVDPKPLKMNVAAGYARDKQGFPIPHVRSNRAALIGNVVDGRCNLGQGSCVGRGVQVCFGQVLTGTSSSSPDARGAEYADGHVEGLAARRRTVAGEDVVWVGARCD